MITDEGVAALRSAFTLTMEGFLRTSVTVRSESVATVFRAKAATLASVLEMLDEANEEVPDAVSTGTHTR